MLGALTPGGSRIETGLLKESLMQAEDIWLGADAMVMIRTETIKKEKTGAGEMAQLFKASTALAED